MSDLTEEGEQDGGVTAHASILHILFCTFKDFFFTMCVFSLVNAVLISALPHDIYMACFAYLYAILFSLAVSLCLPRFVRAISVISL